MILQHLRARLAQWHASQAVTDILADLVALVPTGSHFEADRWECLDWRVLNDNRITDIVVFSGIEHAALKVLAKVWVLDGRLKLTAGLQTARSRIVAMTYLSRILGPRALHTVRTDDFSQAEKLVAKEYGPGTAFRTSAHLAAASNWLATTLQRPLDFQNTLPNPRVHGRYGTEAGRQAKLVSTQVLGDLLAARHQTDLHVRDRFYIDTLMVEMGTGFRPAELMTLPVDCILKETGLQILHFPRKGGAPLPRPVPSRLAEAVEQALKSIQELTEPARQFLRSSAGTGLLDWRCILRDPEATRYFVRQWASAWVADPKHRLINPDGAWCNKTECFVDAIGALHEAGGNKSEAARRLGINRHKLQSFLEDQERATRGELPGLRRVGRRGEMRHDWDTDRRVISVQRLIAHCGVMLTKHSCIDLVQDLLGEAQQAQLRGQRYAQPEAQPEFERRFARNIEALVKTKDGQPLLMQDEALFVLPRYFLSDARSTLEAEPQNLRISSLANWMCGFARSHGTGKQEDSVFNRLNIIDEETGEVAKFTPRDVRHWLNTLYQNGGLTDDQISLIFNRRSRRHTPEYDQTPNNVRVERLKKAVRIQLVTGRVAETYHGVLSGYSREEAERYLEAALRMINPMPHGVCTLNWSTVPCPHQLSCFSCESQAPGPCEHLIIDPGDPAQREEVQRIVHESTLIASVIEQQGVTDSPQLDHFRRVATNASTLLDSMPNQKGVQ
ncbi:helix-turn-helix domain-containing protein [Lysobacter sp. GCM10012299]|uniref:helix-turn-helix domain-containing protein n=1 Tax=Lysobacter sp. GCM10012299 TaxID=3317333 RepID=UPI00362344D3